LRRSTPRRSVSGGGERKKIGKRSEKNVREEEETEKEEGRRERGRRQRGAPAALKRVDGRRGWGGEVHRNSASPSAAAPCSCLSFPLLDVHLRLLLLLLLLRHVDVQNAVLIAGSWSTNR
jgi:hypothetical protein